MELFIFNREIEFQGIFESYYSFIWRRKYHQAGEFELHCLLTDNTLKLLKKGNIITKKDDLEAAYITYRNLTQDEEGQEVLEVRGHFLTNYLGQRIIWGRAVFDSEIENAMRLLVHYQAINPLNEDRKINNLILNNSKGFSQRIKYQVSNRNLLDELERLSNVSGLGYRIILDWQNKRFLFDVYKGLDRTVNQSTNPRAIFSTQFENVLSQDYMETVDKFKNVALIAGEGEGVERKTVSIGEGIGLDRHELFVDAKDLQQEELGEEEYLEQLEQRGKTELSEYQEIISFDSLVNLQSNLTYKKDYDLGDIVTTTNRKWGLTLHSRITEIEEIYEADGMRLNAVFGTALPTRIKERM